MTIKPINADSQIYALLNKEKLSKENIILGPFV